MDQPQKTGPVSNPVKHTEEHEQSAMNPDATYVVDWDGHDDPKNPKNWKFSKNQRIAAELGITNSSLIALLTSIYILGYALGPLLLGPISEIFGRARVLQAANFWYLAWNLACGFARNKGEMITFRFLSGFGGSGTLSIGGGVLGDMWLPEQRGQAVAIYSLAPLLSPVFGPVCGAWIAEKGDWRWVFWAPTIVSVAVQFVGLFFLQETYAPVLLEQKARLIRKKMDAEKGETCDVRTIYDCADREWSTIAQKALLRPFMLLFREPIIQLFGCYMAFVYGTLYLFLTTVTSIFEGVYKQSVGIAGLHYIALGLGLSVISQINAHFVDAVYKHLCAKNDGVGKPEFRLPSMVPGTVLLPIGLLLTGWSARESVHWIVPDIGIVVVGAGMVLNFQTIQTYIIDAFTLHAASALAAVTLLRSLAGFGFPLFAPSMYKALGYGKGNTILACAATVIGIPAPFLFWKYGERIRNASRYAKRA